MLNLEGGYKCILGGGLAVIQINCTHKKRFSIINTFLPTPVQTKWEEYRYNVHTLIRSVGRVKLVDVRFSSSVLRAYPGVGIVMEQPQCPGGCFIKVLNRFWRGLFSESTRAHTNRKSNSRPLGIIRSALRLKTDRSFLTTIITRHRSFYPMNISIPHLKAHMVLEVRAAQRATPICTSRGASQ